MLNVWIKAILHIPLVLGIVHKIYPRITKKLHSWPIIMVTAAVRGKRSIAFRDL